MYTAFKHQVIVFLSQKYIIDFKHLFADTKCRCYQQLIFYSTCVNFVNILIAEFLTFVFNKVFSRRETSFESKMLLSIFLLISNITDLKLRFCPLKDDKIQGKHRLNKTDLSDYTSTPRKNRYLFIIKFIFHKAIYYAKCPGGKLIQIYVVKMNNTIISIVLYYSQEICQAA